MNFDPNNPFGYQYGGDNSTMSADGGNSSFNFGSLDNSNSTDNSDGLFSSWNQQSASTAMQGFGALSNAYFGNENLGLAKKDMSMKKDQHQAWMEDRAEAKAKRDAVSQIRF